MRVDEAAEKIKADWRERSTGECRMFSEAMGAVEECQCVLCCADFLRSEAEKADGVVLAGKVMGEWRQRCRELEGRIEQLQHELRQAQHALALALQREKAREGPTEEVSVEDMFRRRQDNPAITAQMPDNVVIRGSAPNGVNTLSVDDGPVFGAQ